MKIVLQLIILFLFIQICFCSKKPLSEVNLKEYNADALLELIYTHLDQYVGYMPGDLHLMYNIRTMNDYDPKYKNTVFFTYQMGSIFDISVDRLFFLPCDLQYALQFWGDEEDTRDEAVRELYRYIRLIDFSEVGKMHLPMVKEHPQFITESTSEPVVVESHAISNIIYTDIVIESNTTSTIV